MDRRANNPRRRWFRFGLRTMFVVVTAFSVWLAWQANQVSKRRAVIADVLARGGMVDNEAPNLRNGADYHTATADRREQLPRMWVVMGAKPIGRLMVPIGEFSLEERERINSAFPELGNGLGLPVSPADASR